MVEIDHYRIGNIVGDKNEAIRIAAAEALNDETKLHQLVEALAVSSRRERQIAASTIHVIATMEPEKLTDSIDELVDALNRPEAQTRWEALDTLAIMVDYDARTCNKALAEAETCLFDEESGPVRLGAVRFLCKLGATTANRSEKVWPLIDEAIQCYHGDLEFNDMLTAIVEFSRGKLAPEVKEAFIARMTFDANNGKGTLKKRAQQIIDNLQD